MSINHLAKLAASGCSMPIPEAGGGATVSFPIWQAPTPSLMFPGAHRVRGQASTLT